MQIKLNTKRAYQRLWNDKLPTITQFIGRMVMALIVGSVYYGTADNTNAFFLLKAPFSSSRSSSTPSWQSLRSMLCMPNDRLWRSSHPFTLSIIPSQKPSPVSSQTCRSNLPLPLSSTSLFTSSLDFDTKSDPSSPILPSSGYQCLPCLSFTVPSPRQQRLSLKPWR